jgi:predicted ATPase
MKTRTGFYFRADDFISYIRQTKKRKMDALQALEEIEDPHSMARMPHANTLYELNQLYSQELDTLSHGQAFLELFRSRLRPNGLYFLDEPESPLTPQNQLALLRLIYEAQQMGSQFVISTHSPILMAYPDADLIEIRKDSLAKVTYDEIEYVSFLQNFLQSPKHYIHYVLKDEEE